MRISFGIYLRKSEMTVFVQVSTSIVANPNPRALVAVLDTAKSGQSPRSWTTAGLFFQIP